MSLSEILDLHPQARLAWEVAEDAGSFLRDDRPAQLNVDVKSTPTDAVTDMDRGAEARIVSRLLAERPEDAIVGEEGTSTQGRTGLTWIIDPLDGTVNYLFGLPTWGVSVGLEVDGVGEVGVIMTPEFHEGFLAVRGHGAWRIRGDEATRMWARDCPSLDQALVVTGFGYAPERRRAQAELLTAIITHVRDMRRSGCATIDLAWLALGRTDAFFERGLNVWDYAAGLVIAREAGVDTALIHGPKASGDLMICAVPSIAAELTDLLLRNGADRGP